MALDLVVSQPLPAGTELTLDALDSEGNPVPIRRIELDEPSDRVVFENFYPHRVLSLCITPGDGGAHTAKPFFKVGATYVEDKPHAAPEIRRYFRVSATDRHPDTGARVAFGFGQVGNHPWVLVILDQDQWDSGDWIEQGSEPDAAEDDEVVEAVAQAWRGEESAG